MVVEPTREELLELYKIALEEYRFQVNLNWNRTQYYLVLNLGILSAATGILQLAQKSVVLLVAGIYLGGVVCCLLAVAATRVQKSYYSQTCEHKAHIETKLKFSPDISLATTASMGGLAHRLGKVTTFINVMLFSIAVLDCIGAAVVLTR